MNGPARKFTNYRVAAGHLARKWTDPRGWVAAILMVFGWYLLVYLIVRPLADAPVADSWVYSNAVDFFRRNGSIRFAGYSQATPLLQVLYGAAWSRVFGVGAASLDLSVAMLGALGGLCFYALARRCGARGWGAILATALLIANPCYLYMSFSFMTEIPFLALLLGAHLAFSCAREDESRWLWPSALLAALAFMVRPFAAAAMVGSAVAVLITERAKRRPIISGHTIKMIAPFAAGSLLCMLGWIWLTRFNPEPWMLRQSEGKLAQFFDVSPAIYVGGGLIGPLFYLGVVLSPMALPHLLSASWRKGIVIAASLMAIALVSMRLAAKLPATPELSCFGGWRNALLLRGLPNTFAWHDGSTHAAAMILAALGAAGLILAASNLPRPMRPATLAVILTAAIYWLGLIPLWFFNDRYYLVLVPAACLMLALAPPERMAGRVAAITGVIVLALISLAGVDDHQRALGTVAAIRDDLERSGVARSDIDAGYALNGGDLYHENPTVIERWGTAPRIPMITSDALARFTIAAAPVEGTRVIRRAPWPGPLGCDGRGIYVLERTTNGKP
ncbi:MAG TPA: glycosyltransferase family 39 protein [Candidatus Binataceae bacterium]|nr:glycosyltransferase family 39 protein [Candidatus Binataceae bacterium]